jgi:hypothetical protein
MKRERLLQFFKAAGRIGGGSVVLAIVLFLISIEEHLSARNVPAAWLIFLGCMVFCYGACAAWSNEHDAHIHEIEKNLKPLLQIELLGSFFDVSKMPNKNELQVHVYAYLRVTNTGHPDTLIKNGTLTMTVGGNRHTGAGEDISVKGNSIKHVSNFKIGGEVANADVFGNTFSPFPKLFSRVTPGNPLRRGLSQEGFFTFTFPESMNWDCSNPYVMPATDVTIHLTDSFNGEHAIHQDDLSIEEGKLQMSGLFPFSLKT